jgi:hypothetical protein
MQRTMAAVFATAFLLGCSSGRIAEEVSRDEDSVEYITPPHKVVEVELLVDDRILVGGSPLRNMEKIEGLAGSLRASKYVFRITSGLGIPRTRLVEIMSVASRTGYANIEVDSRRYIRSRVTLDVIDGGRWFVNDLEVAEAELRSQLERAKAESGTDFIIITPSYGAAMGAVDTAMSAARAAGLQSVQIMSDALGNTNLVGEDLGYLEIVSEPTQEEKIKELVDLYSDMRPDLAAQILQLGGMMDDSVKAHLIRRLPHGAAVQILNRLPEVSAMRVGDIIRELSLRKGGQRGSQKH